MYTKKKFVTKKRSKTQVVIKLKNSNVKKKLKTKTQMMTKPKNPNSDKTQKVKLWQNSNCDKTLKLKLWPNFNTQIVTKLKNSNCGKTWIMTNLNLKVYFSKNIWHCDNLWYVLWEAFCDSRNVFFFGQTVVASWWRVCYQ